MGVFLWARYPCSVKSQPTLVKRYRITAPERPDSHIFRGSWPIWKPKPRRLAIETAFRSKADFDSRIVFKQQGGPAICSRTRERASEREREIDRERERERQRQRQTDKDTEIERQRERKKEREKKGGGEGGEAHPTHMPPFSGISRNR